MPHFNHVSRNLVLFVTISAGLTGCQQPVINVPQKSWSQRFSEKMSGIMPSKKQESPDSPFAPAEKADSALTSAEILEHNGDYERAIAAYAEILRKDKRRTDLHHRLATLYDRNGEMDKATKHYQLALKKTPKDANLLCDYGYHNYLINKQAEAEKLLRRSLDHQPNNARAHNNLGLVLARTGRQNEALAEFKRAGISESAAHLNLAYALLWEKKLDDAAREIDIALAADPKSKPANEALDSLQTVVNVVQREQRPTVLQTNFEEKQQPSQLAERPVIRK